MARKNITLYLSDEEVNELRLIGEALSPINPLSLSQVVRHLAKQELEAMLDGLPPVVPDGALDHRGQP